MFNRYLHYLYICVWMFKCQKNETIQVNSSFQMLSSKKSSYFKNDKWLPRNTAAAVANGACNKDGFAPESENTVTFSLQRNPVVAIHLF